MKLSRVFIHDLISSHTARHAAVRGQPGRRGQQGPAHEGLHVHRDCLLQQGTSSFIIWGLEADFLSF